MRIVSRVEVHAKIDEAGAWNPSNRFTLLTTTTADLDLDSPAFKLALIEAADFHMMPITEFEEFRWSLIGSNAGHYFKPIFSNVREMILVRQSA